MNFDSTLTMISLAYICITCLSWILCLTVGLPLTLAVYFSKSFRSSFFSWGYYRLAEPFFKTHLEVSRKKAFNFKILKDSLKDRTGPLEVLEIRLATANLQFYQRTAHSTGQE
ncbi:hypothetical protein AVEN_64617-1 [Araneus ventricosus]|uniref:Uncharacterized protein n=1 Tax=Araneus ventricosus TaxID=182803 RepID=A0A4Y2QBS6_ARAVE|nr:hypothetical protein AVEN_64617-1 [Araneus ventricosus]